MFSPRLFQPLGLTLSLRRESDLNCRRCSSTRLINLNTLDLQLNVLITGLPAEIGQLTNLVELDLKGTGLTRLPSEIGNLTPLTYLDLEANALSELPKNFSKLTEKPITVVAPELIGLQSPASCATSRSWASVTRTWISSKGCAGAWERSARPTACANPCYPTWSGHLSPTSMRQSASSGATLSCRRCASSESNSIACFCLVWAMATW